MIRVDELREKYGIETALIILCCRVYFETASLIELAAFVEDNNIDWQKFMRLTRAHRIRPIVYKTIYQADIPLEIKLRVHAEYNKTTKQNFLQAIETERIILRLKSIGIESVPYKGVAFSQQFFGDLVSRESSDIDLIIHPDDLTGAAELLKEDGYVPELDDIYQYLGKKYFSYFKDYNLDKFTAGRRDFHVEFHWAIAEKEIGVDHSVNSFLFDGNGERTFVKASVKTLSKDGHFSAVLVHHALKDNFRYLKTLVDIGQAIKHREIKENGDLLKQQFKVLSLLRPLTVGTSLCNQLFGISLLQVDDVKITPDLSEHFIGQVCQTDRFTPVNEKEEMALWFKNTALLQDNFFRKLRFYLICLSFRFIPGWYDFRMVQLPKPLFFLYYLMKPFRTSKKIIEDTERRNKAPLVTS